MSEQPLWTSSGEGGDTEVAPSEWGSFLENFSRQHQNWLVTIEVATPKGRLVVVAQRRLKGMSLESAAKKRAYIEVSDKPDEHITHAVNAPTRLIFKRTQAGAHQGIEIMSADGSITTIRFRSAAWPEAIDGIIA
jgi:hypothetical protein